jgi:Protein of unknown function (DUF998)
MTAFAYVAAALVIAWAALAIVAQLLNPEQSPLSMGMSGLARGHAPWVMKSAFLCRGGSALVLLLAVPGVLGAAGLALVGVVAFWVWGVGSAALAVVDTDMPGEPPSRAGAAHALVALVAYVAGVAGALALSLALRGDGGTRGLGAWALALALAAAIAMVAQFVAFGAAAREARAAAPPAAAPVIMTAASIAAHPSAPAAASAPPLADVPPQLAGAGSAAGTHPAPASGGSSSLSPSSLAGYAGLLQRIFLGLLMAWTLLVALGIGRL